MKLPWSQQSLNPIRLHHGCRDEVGGPFIKLERMNRYFPNYPQNYNIVYGVSGTNLPLKTLNRARKKGIPIVCHMNSCWHPAYADDFDEKNHLLKMLHSEYADYVVYGSQQAMLGAERYLGPINLRHCRIFNAVDITHFTVGEKLYARPQVLAAGLHQFTHRLKPLILAMPEVAQAVPDVELVIAGKLVEGEGICDCGPDTIRAIVQQSGFKQVRFIDTYTQQEAPEIYRRANVLVHLKHMDWTPNVVAEAMACGVPVVHTGNGGTPEIVDDAGVSLNIPADWDHILEADPAVVAAAIVKVLEEQGSLAKRAREIAYTRFNLEEWIREHEEIFSELLQLR